MGYREAWAVQRQRHQLRVEGSAPDTLILVEHPPVITLGRAFAGQSLLLTEQEYQQRGIEVVRTDRGGDVTYHGPGQLVGYPIFDLKDHGADLHKFLRAIEEALIEAVAEFGIKGVRSSINTGVWVHGEKLAAIGIKVSKWVSLHGFALNVDPDMSAFDLIVPCGLTGYRATSMAAQLGEPPSMDAVKQAVNKRISTGFDLDLDALNTVL